MKLTSVIAIFALFWVMSAFVLLPFGVKTDEEAGVQRVPGQADSAPHEFRPVRIMGRATLLAAILFGLYYANWTQGWITRDSFAWMKPAGL